MPSGAPVPTLRDPASCRIRIGGREPTALYPLVAEVRVDAARTEAAVATLRFDEERGAAGGWTVQDDPALAPWAPIRIDAVFGARTVEVFRGFVRELAAEHPEGDRPSVVVECQDESLALDRTHERAVWGTAQAPTSDAAIVAAIARRYQLAPDPTNGPGFSGLVLHQDGTDIRFLRRRAEANGYELVVSGGTLYFGPMRLGNARQPTIVVSSGPATTCLRFAVRVDGHRPDLVGYFLAPSVGAQVTSARVAPNVAILGTRPADSRGAGLSDFVWLLSREGSASAPELAARAQAKANEASLRIRATGELDGTLYGHVLQVGLPVGVAGVGDRFAGSYYVDRVTHVFSQTGYRQAFELVRNGYGDDLAAAPAASLAGVL